MAKEQKERGMPPARPAHPIDAVKAQLASIEKLVNTIDDIEMLRALVGSQVEAARLLLGSFTVMMPGGQRPQPSGPSGALPTFSGPVRMNGNGRVRHAAPPINVSPNGDVTRGEDNGD